MQKQPQIHSGSLRLADGSSWEIAAEDSCGAEIAHSLAECMQLTTDYSATQKMLILKNGLSSKGYNLNFLSEKNLQSLAFNHQITCQLYTAPNNDTRAALLMKLSYIFCSQAEARGGLLVHGALAVKNGMGVILAGPGDVGKTTASKRLPSPWQALCDDCTLIVRDSYGTYHAHPWPTWSTFMFGGSGGTWDVQKSVALHAIFLLSQNPRDHVEPIGQGKAVCQLKETAEQAWQGISSNLENYVKRKLRLQRFNNICDLVKSIPAYQLQISKDGKFWKEMERVL